LQWISAGLIRRHYEFVDNSWEIRRACMWSVMGLVLRFRAELFIS